MCRGPVTEQKLCFLLLTFHDSRSECTMSHNTAAYNFRRSEKCPGVCLKKMFVDISVGPGWIRAEALEEERAGGTPTAPTAPRWGFNFQPALVHVRQNRIKVFVFRFIFIPVKTWSSFKMYQLPYLSGWRGEIEMLRNSYLNPAEQIGVKSCFSTLASRELSSDV